MPQEVEAVAVFGPADGVLRAIRTAVPDVELSVRDRQVNLQGGGGRVAIVAGFIEELIKLARSGKPLSASAAGHALSLLTSAATPSYGTGANTEKPPAANLGLRQHSLIDPLVLTAGGVAKVVAQSPGQALYQRAINENTVIFGIGPAGTGKTYLAMAEAVKALLTGQVKRIILTRPAVEAGENLGFLPGSLTDKIDPYLRPLYDALYDLMDPEAVPKLLAASTIEVAPLAYMRGRTLNDAFVVLDEAQNTTAQQMKMFLTRLGFNSKMVVTGDATQVDLPGGVRSGLKMAEQILEGIPEIAICRLTSADVVRHELVGKIIDAYDRYEATNLMHEGGKNHSRRRQ